MENLNKTITNAEEAKNEVEQRHINPDVFNALNLYDEKLGEEYEKEGYNPFSPDFKLTQEFAMEVMEAKPNGKPMPKENFLEFGAKKVTSHFKNTLAAGEKLISKLEHEMSALDLNSTTAHQIQMAIIFLKNRNQLLKRNIRELKFKKANAIQMFADMYALDKELSELLKETYEPNADLNVVLANFMRVCNNRANEIIKNRKEQEKAREQKIEREHDMLQAMADAQRESINDAKEFASDLLNAVGAIATATMVATAATAATAANTLAGTPEAIDETNAAIFEAGEELTM